MEFDPELIKSFVRTDLGCKCPDEIFNLIKYEKDVKLHGKWEIDHVYTIGDRLLVIIVVVKRPFNKKNLETLIKFGKTMRDDNELNRFRLVLLTHKIKNAKRFKKRNEELFRKNSKVDKKMHLHILENDAF